jgi:hypothetical protein
VVEEMSKKIHQFQFHDEQQVSYELKESNYGEVASGGL